jgi:hypothetical protein
MADALPKEPKQEQDVVTRRRIALCAFGMLAMLAFWLSVRLTFSELDLSELVGLWAPALAFILFGAMIGWLGTSASLLHASNLGGFTLLVGSLIPLLLFPITWVTLAACLVAVIAWGRYWGMVSEETTSRIRYSLTKSVTHSLGTVVTLTVLSVALCYLGFVSLRHETSQTFVERVSTGTSDSILTLFERKLPGFQRTMTVDEFLLAFSEKDLASAFPQDFLPNEVSASLLSNESRTEIATLDDAAKVAALSSARTQLLTPFGLNVDGDQSMETLVRAIIGQKITPVLERYERFIPSVLALALFSALSILGGVYFWWVVGWAWVWYGLVRGFGWLTVREETLPVHRVEFKG